MTLLGGGENVEGSDEVDGRAKIWSYFQNLLKESLVKPDKLFPSLLKVLNSSSAKFLLKKRGLPKFQV